MEITLPETNIAPENAPSQKERIVFQPSFLSGKLLNFGGVNLRDFPFKVHCLGWCPTMTPMLSPKLSLKLTARPCK